MNELAEIPVRLAQLRQAEAMAVEGAGNIIAGQNMVAIALHKIVTQKLYLEDKDDEGVSKFKTFESYWPSLELKMGISRAQAFNLLRDIRIATGPTFQLDYERFARLGGTAAFGALIDFIEYNQKTGEVYGVKEDYELPQGQTAKDFIIEHLQYYAPSEIDELNLNMTQRRDVLRKTLSSEKSITVEWFLVELTTPEGTRYRTKYEKTISSRDGDTLIEGFIDDPNVPEDVMEAYKKRLRVAGLYKFD